MSWAHLHMDAAAPSCSSGSSPNAGSVRPSPWRPTPLQRVGQPSPRPPRRRIVDRLSFNARILKTRHDSYRLRHRPAPDRTASHPRRPDSQRVASRSSPGRRCVTRWSARRRPDATVRRRLVDATLNRTWNAWSRWCVDAEHSPGTTLGVAGPNWGSGGSPDRSAWTRATVAVTVFDDGNAVDQHVAVAG